MQSNARALFSTVGPLAWVHNKRTPKRLPILRIQWILCFVPFWLWAVIISMQFVCITETVCVYSLVHTVYLYVVWLDLVYRERVNGYAERKRVRNDAEDTLVQRVSCWMSRWVQVFFARLLRLMTMKERPCTSSLWQLETQPIDRRAVPITRQAYLFMYIYIYIYIYFCVLIP